MAQSTPKNHERSNRGFLKKIKKSFKEKSNHDFEGKNSVPLIDYPQENEKVLLGSYSIRIAAELFSEVQVSVSGGAWQSCRPAVGYWWLDWSPRKSAEYTLVARSRVGNGSWLLSQERHFFVIGASGN